MRKLAFVIKPGPQLGLPAFCHKILEEMAPRLLEEEPAAVKVSLTEPGLTKPFYLPVKQEGMALVSVWTGQVADEERICSAVESFGLDCSGYRVTESVPRGYNRSWRDGQRTPGAALLTLFRKNPRITQDEFLRRWHEGHSPMALRIHPLWSYIRNVVEEPITEGAALFDGIVEEHFLSELDLSDPTRFFGGVFPMVPRLVHILVQTSTFLDHRSLENYILAEYHILGPK